MFKVLGTACSRASTSTPTYILPQFLVPSFSAPIHTSRPAFESARNEAARLRKKRNQEFHLQRAALERQAAPHPVLGLPDTPEGEAQWRSCDLALILVDEKAIQDAPITPIDFEQIQLPEYYQFGISGSDERVLFETLPAVDSAAGIQLYGEKSQTELQENLQLGQARTHLQASYLSRIVDLRNANAGGIAFENRRRCILAFGEHEEDSGRSEVQAAILTVQIRKLWDHLKTHRKDVHNQRNLKFLVHKRAKILKYLERLDAARYDDLLPRLGLDPRAVKGEIIVKFK